MANVQISNQGGEAGGLFVNTTGSQTGNFDTFKFVEESAFGSITNELFTGISNVTAKTLAAGDLLVLDGTTQVNLSSGSCFVYNTV